MRKKEIMHKTSTLFIAIISTLIFSTPLLSQKNVIDEVIAVVGDNAILKSDVEYQYQQAVMQGVSAKGNLKCKLFEQQLIQKLMLKNIPLDKKVKYVFGKTQNIQKSNPIIGLEEFDTLVIALNAFYDDIDVVENDILYQVIDFDSTFINI